MKFKKQNQHGVWAMIFMPVILGMIGSGFHFSQILYLAGWLFIFLAADHVLFFVKRFKRKEYDYLVTALVFGLASAVLFIWPLLTEYRIIYFFLAMLPLSAVNVYYAKNKDERNIINDMTAILIFSIAGGAAAFHTIHEFNQIVAAVIIISFIHFAGTAFVVKTVIRERKNKMYHKLSYAYHGIVLIIMLFWNWILAVAFLPSFMRAVYVAGRKITPKQLVILEIVHAVWITACMTVYFNVYL